MKAPTALSWSAPLVTRAMHSPVGLETSGLPSPSGQMVVCSSDILRGCLLSFVTRALSFYSYLKEFGFTIPDRPIVVDDIRVRGCGKSGISSVYKSKMGQKRAKSVTVCELKHTV